MKVLITGGLGFIGCNAVKLFSDKGYDILVVDNMSRRGVEINKRWLDEVVGPRYRLETTDVRDYPGVARAVRRFDPDVILHLAGQVAVTTSTVDPRLDFEVNALGTLNVLEAVRQSRGAADNAPLVIYASTNKVYGDLHGVVVEDDGERGYRIARPKEGICEAQALDLQCPYGCSKGCGDQYMVTYGRLYGIPTVTARQSCIYGPNQLGAEDQGWVAWFCIAAIMGIDITIYGDGRQVRDVLHVSDLLRLYEILVERWSNGHLSSQAFNIGGGPANALSLLDLVALLEEELGHPLQIRHSAWRPGDQKVYISDIRKARAELAWEPKIGAREGIAALIRWVRNRKSLLLDLLSVG